MAFTTIFAHYIIMMKRGIMKNINIRTRKAIIFSFFILYIIIQFTVINMDICFADEISQVDSTQAQKTAVALARERFGVIACVDENGFITSMGSNSGISIATDDIDPLEVAYFIFEQNRDLFGLDNPREELVLHNIGRGEAGSVAIAFRQMEHGLEVENAFYQVHLGPTSDSQKVKLLSMEGRIFPSASKLSTSPAIDSAKADSVAMGDTAHGESSVSVGAPTHLAISEFEDILHLVWRVNIINGGYGGSAAYWIDAQTGTILKAVSALRQ
jgi:hypothetical protein